MANLGASSESALDMAMQFEKDGRDYFLKAKERVSLDMAKRIFQALADEEIKHMEILETIYKDLKENKGFPTALSIDPNKDFIRIFEEDKKNINEKYQTHSTELEALTEALALEKRGQDMYQNLMNQSKDEKERIFFAALAEEEKKHYDFINSYLTYFWDHGMRMNE